PMDRREEASRKATGPPVRRIKAPFQVRSKRALFQWPHLPVEEKARARTLSIDKVQSDNELEFNPINGKYVL
ncbi:hypothetical protein ACERJO_20370, partial [Halalkalibacter sp. AB-rgal2]